VQRRGRVSSKSRGCGGARIGGVGALLFDFRENYFALRIYFFRPGEESREEKLRVAAGNKKLPTRIFARFQRRNSFLRE
jgi:hypothetical protein